MHFGRATSSKNRSDRATLFAGRCGRRECIGAARNREEYSMHQMHMTLSHTCSATWSKKNRINLVKYAETWTCQNSVQVHGTSCSPQVVARCAWNQGPYPLEQNSAVKQTSDLCIFHQVFGQFNQIFRPRDTPRLAKRHD